MRLIHGFSRAGRRALGLFLVLLSVSAPLAAQSDPNFAIVTSGHTGSGTLVNDERGIPVTRGDLASADTVPPLHSYLASVPGCGGGSVRGVTFTTAPIYADCTLFAHSAVLMHPSYIVTPGAAAHGSSPNIAVTVPANNRITVTADPGSASGSCDDSLVLHADGTAGTRTVAVRDADCTAVAPFGNAPAPPIVPAPIVPPPPIPPVYFIYAAGPNGSISGDATQTIAAGTTHGTPVTAVPDLGCSFVQWSDGLTTNPRTDDNHGNVINVTASFAINNYTLTYTAGPNGTVSGTSPQTINVGGSGTAVTALPNQGYSFVQWSDGLTSNPRTDSNVAASIANISISASFAINSYTLTATAGPNGTITPLTQQVNDGTPASLTVTPNTGYQMLLDPSTTCPVGTLLGTTYTIAAISANCLFAVTFLAEPAPVLAITITDNRDYARNGMLLNYVITLTNSGTADATGVTLSSTLSAPLDAANTSSICVGAGSGSVCPASGIGNITTGIVLPAGRTLVWLVSAPVLLQPIGTTVDYSVSAALSGASPISATDSDMLVVFRDTFDVPSGDGTQAIPLLPLACAAVLDLAGAGRQSFVMPSTAAHTPIETLLAAHSDTAAAGFRVERLSWHGSQGVRLVSIAADGSERASAWAMTQAGAALTLATVQATDGRRQLLLEGTAVSLQISLPIGIAAVLPLHAPASSQARCQ